MIHSFRKRIESGPPVLADGAMGTQLYERLGYRYLCFEELNVTNPQLVQTVHRAYLSAGAEMIETNTFGCNRYLLGMRGLESEVGRFARAGARIAREAQEAMGAETFVAGAVGPLNRLGLSTEEIRSAFEEVIQGLVLGGVDLFIFETFGDLEELLVALDVARGCSNLPVIASMTFSEDGLTLAGQQPRQVATSLQSAGADVVAANCGFGPQPTLEVLERMRFETGPALGAMPNAGLPARIDGRLVYASGPEYFAEYAMKFAATGARVIGGCCGTTPDHIRSMGDSIAADKKSVGPESSAGAPAYSFAPPEVAPRADQLEGATAFTKALQSGDFVISVEMRPPRGANPRKVLRNAELLRDSGVTVVDVTDSALGRVRMNPFFIAYLIQAYTGLEVVAHLTTRDRNIMALQADLIGAHAVGIRHVLALSGDPPNPNSFAPATGVYDLDSIGLIALIKKLNQGQDAAGTSIGSPTNFLVGCSLNPTAEDLELELDRFARKLEAGADFVMTQAVYDGEQFRCVLDRIGPLDVPLILELLPLQSFKNAEFIHNELAGVTLPALVLERMERAGSNGVEEGMAIARETFHELRSLVQGIYLIPSFDRYEQAAELTREFASTTTAAAAR
jgi:methionine synthase / methylenetetrahydrofolate reductase(NADPH)